MRAGSLIFICLFGLSACREMMPDLSPMRIVNLDVYEGEDDEEVVGFSSSIMNPGEGPFEVFSEENLRIGRGMDSTSTAYQVIYDDNGRVSRRVKVGDFVYHDEHNHWHVEAAAKYSVVEANDDGTGGRFGRNSGLIAEKVSFCMRDSVKMNPSVRNDRRYRRCSGQTQGINAGYNDFYNYSIPGQNFSSAMLRTGKVYYIINEVNPRRNFLETNFDNNLTWTSFVLREGRRGRTLEEIAHARCDGVSGGCGEYYQYDNLDLNE